MDDLVLALTGRGKLEIYKPMAAATLRDLARALVEMADNIMIPPNVSPQKDEPNEQEV